ncbi:transcriptional repressor [Microcystis phage Mae-Yong1326-1]|nr:transcriptional repressor [Microcystis phage Mae-Yong1326-1]
MTKAPIRRTMPSPDAGRPMIETMGMASFARRLHEAMLRKGWNQSDVARAMWGEVTDNRGYKVARNRDRVSQYLRGESIPEAANLQKLADIFGMDVADLAPDLVASAVDKARPEVALTAIAGHPDRVHLVVNKLVPLAVAARVVAIISDLEDSK